MNRVILFGNIGGDVRLIDGPKTKIAKFSVATHENVKGDRKTTWHQITAFGKLADICQRKVIKGSKVLVEGKLQTSSTVDNETGNRKYRVDIVAHSIQVIPKGERTGNENISTNPSSENVDGFEDESLEEDDSQANYLKHMDDDLDLNFGK